MKNLVVIEVEDSQDGDPQVRILAVVPSWEAADNAINKAIEEQLDEFFNDDKLIGEDSREERKAMLSDTNWYDYDNAQTTNREFCRAEIEVYDTVRYYVGEPLYK